MIAAIESTEIYADSDSLSSLLTPLVECPCIGTAVHNRISVVDIDLMKGMSNIGILRKGMGDRVTTGILGVHDIARIGRSLLRLKLARERCVVVAAIETVDYTRPVILLINAVLSTGKKGQTGSNYYFHSFLLPLTVIPAV